MTVGELEKLLKDIENKDMPVFCTYDGNYGLTGLYGRLEVDHPHFRHDKNRLILEGE